MPGTSAQRVQKMIAEATGGEEVLIIDDAGFPKQGTASVGVARQYSGTLGKVGNCQMAVTCCDSDPHATWPAGVRLSLPKTWAHAPERWGQTGVPAETPFHIKPEMALALLDQACAWGVPHRGYVVGVRIDFQVRMGCAATSPVWRADELLLTGPRWQGRTIRWRRGTKGVA